ncbi:MAG: family 16 glycoside hydrolase [Polyangiaceae bacterium]
MFERAATGVRRAGWASLIALASCATAHETIPPEGDAPNAGGPGAAGAGAAAGSSAQAGSSAAGMPNSAAGASSVGGAVNGVSGAAGANTAGSHAGGSAGASTGSAGNHAGGAGGGSAGSGSAGAATAGGGSVLFSDDFEDGNANGWVVDDGTWAIATDGSKVYAQQGTSTGSSVLLSAAGSTAWTNQSIEAKIKVKAFGGSSTSYFAAIYGRYNGTDYYSLVLRSDGKVAIRKNTSTLGSAVAAGIVAGTWYTVRLEIVGSTLKAYVNGTLTDTETDTSLTAGGIAVSTVNTTAEFDDVKVSLP